MSFYIVLARKYRPQNFDEIIGQGHITDLLKKSIETGRLAHAFLLTGPRGVGKTSCARILAKSLNCQKGPTLIPCENCSSCREITQAMSFDVIEIDGASNRGIDEVRTLRENVKFAPSYGRFKIYIVDEVHMLTPEAFNALLKTLEEPPAHVKFIFATTAPAKVPDTIISRCQRFDFKRISVQTIVDQLTKISSTEKLKVENEALFAIAKAASGSMRDALSILDQLSALTQRSIQLTDVNSMLGLVETELLFALTGHIAQKNCVGALEVFDKIIEQGKDVKQFSRDLIEHFRNLMVMKVGGQALSRLVDHPVAVKERLLSQSQEFSLSDILKAIDVLIESQDVARLIDSPRIPLEVAFAQLTYSLTPKAPAPALIVPATNPKPVIQTEPAEDLTIGVREQETAAPKEGITLEKIRKSWDAITYAISREKMSVATYLQDGSPHEWNGSRLVIGFPNHATFHKEALEEKSNKHLVEKVFTEKLRGPVRVEFSIVAAHQPQDHEEHISEALQIFKGKVVNKWHKD